MTENSTAYMAPNRRTGQTFRQRPKVTLISKTFCTFLGHQRPHTVEVIHALYIAIVLEPEGVNVTHCPNLYLYS